MPSNAEMVDYIMPISTNYVFGGSRYSPYNTDCSGMMCAAMWHVHGVDPYTFGDCTGAQWNGGLLRKLWWGTDPYLPWDIMQKGDFIYTSTVAPSFDTGQGSHVGLYTGDPNAPFLSHFANGGPFVTAVNGVYSGNERYFGLARYMPGSEDDMEASDILGFKNPNMYLRKNDENIDVYQMIWNASKQLTRTDTAGHDNPDGHDLFGRVQIIEKDVREIKSAISKIKGGDTVVAEIDYGKLAKMTADEFASRMKD